MRQVAVVAWREIVDHRMFFLAALAALAVTLFVPVIPAFVGWSPDDVREALMWGMTLGFTWLIAVLLGGAMITGAVARGRFGFFMSRPLSDAAIWFGKLAGVMAVVLVCEFIVLVPAALLADRDWFVDEVTVSPWIWLGILVGFPLLLVLLSHAVATSWRGRSVWVGLEVVGVVLTGSMAWIVFDLLTSIHAYRAAAIVGLVLLVGLASVLLIGGQLQIARGRSDGRRQHKVFTLAVWPLLLVFVGTATAYGLWFVHPEMADVKYVDGDVVIHAGGDWITVAGPARGRFDINAQFLLNLKTRESVRIGTGLRWFGHPLSRVVAERRVAWFVDERDGWVLHSGTVDEVPGGGQRSAISVEGEPRMALAAGGDRVAVIEGNQLVVSTLPEGNLLGSARLEDDRFFLGPFFWSEDRIWVLESRPSRDRKTPPPIRALELDVTENSFKEVGVLDRAGIAISATVDVDRDRILLGTAYRGQLGLRYLDADGFSDVSWSSERDLGWPATMLADGRLVHHWDEGGESAIEVLTPGGVMDARFELPSRWVQVTFGAQPTATTLVIGAHETMIQGWHQRSSPCYSVDLESGEIHRIADEIVPLAWTYSRLEMVKSLPAGCELCKTFLGRWGPDEHIQLLQWHPETGELERIVPNGG